MAVTVVVAFEVIDIEHDQPQRAATAPRAGDLVRQCVVKPAAVRQPGERVLQRQLVQRVVCLAQLRLGAHPAANLPQQGDAEQRHGQQHQRDDHRRADHALAPGGQHRLARRAGLDHQRVFVQRLVAVHAFDVIDDRTEHRRAGACPRQQLGKHLALGQAGADDAGVERPADEDGAVVQGQHDDALLVDVEALVEQPEILDVEGRQHHAGEAAVRRVDAP